MLHCQEHDSAEKLVMDFAARKQIRLVRVVMSGVGAPEERAARKVLHKAMADVRSWTSDLPHFDHGNPYFLT